MLGLYGLVSVGTVQAAPGPAPPAPPLRPVIPVVTTVCGGDGTDWPLARVGPEGQVRGLPADHVGPMRLEAPGELPFSQAVLALRALQQLGGRVGLVARERRGREVAVVASLESDLACSPRTTAGGCATASGKAEPVTADATSGAIGLLGTGSPASLLPEVTFLLLVRGAEVTIATRSGGPTVATIPLAGLGASLRELRTRFPGAPTYRLDATAGTPWRNVVEAVAVSQCALLEAAEPGFDAVLLGW